MTLLTQVPSMLKIAILCGGPSLERGISLNSARSLLDHLPSDLFTIQPIYIDQRKRFFAISSSHLYSNTPSDFDFKLHSIGREVDLSFLHTVDLVFPALHGPFGEDGEIQALLEEAHIPFVGPSSTTCKELFFKHKANRSLEQLGFPVLPYAVVTPQSPLLSIEGRTIVKPSSGGSSIGVFSVDSVSQAQEKIDLLFSLFADQHVIVEPFCRGKEFTVSVIETPSRGVVALTPTEIETCYDNHQILDFRKKYLPTHETFYHTPPRFPKEAIQAQAVALFKQLHVRDFIRMDGWVMEDGTLYFSDFNPISGLEQNSFLFRQGAVDGWTHEEILLMIIENACHRFHLPFPKREKTSSSPKKKVFVLFGGKTAERQVSLMSGTNVWLKLLKSDRFDPIPCLLDQDDNVFALPYHMNLNHTVEEILPQAKRELTGQPLSAWIDSIKEERAFVFLALHGGIGENGELQALLEKAHISFNGSSSKASHLCMDKVLTGEVIRKANISGLLSLPKKILFFEKELPSWQELAKDLGAETLIIKPRSDGCSAGIVRLTSAKDLLVYAEWVRKKSSTIPPATFPGQLTPIEMPQDCQEFLLEPYIETDPITLSEKAIKPQTKTGWIEFTVGVLEEKGCYTSLLPSLTIAENGILSLEEKFQGGTGINITPPPPSILSQTQLTTLKRQVETTALLLGIQNYARIDLFFNRLTDQVIIIEANSLPGLTPSTVLYHQALAETPPLTPRAFLEKIIDSKLSLA